MREGQRQKLEEPAKDSGEDGRWEAEARGVRGKRETEVEGGANRADTQECSRCWRRGAEEGVSWQKWASVTDVKREN